MKSLILIVIMENLYNWLNIQGDSHPGLLIAYNVDSNDVNE